MKRSKFLILISLTLALAVTGWGVDQTRAQSSAAAQPQKAVNAQPVMLAQADPDPQADAEAPADVQPQADVQQPAGDVVTQAPTSTGSDRLDNYLRMYSVTPAQREAAAKRAQANRDAAALAGGEENQVSSFAAPQGAVVPTPGGTPDYFGIYPNYANSPTNIRKFVDSLPGLGASNASTNGQYITVANPDTTTYSGADYYEIGLQDYSQKLHTDLPATKFRGYYQINSGTTGVTDHANKYLGPVIVAKKDRPVRILFENKLLTGTAGNLFIPVDTSAMGAGTGPNGGTELYSENRADIHLHGGATPWISDGTPHQWITPAGDPTSYKKGLSFQNVPDMVGPGKAIPSPSPTDGLATLYYTNQQSSRLMFYHDHAYGLTRLNVYAGEAAGYLLWDQVEDDFISGTNVSGSNPWLMKAIPGQDMVTAGKPEYKYGIPLIIQDKTFVDATKIDQQDPTWNWGSGAPGTRVTGDLWFPHVYMPNQNPNDLSGANAMGRWDYGPWFWPPLTPAAGLVHGEVPNPYFGQPNEPPNIPGTPNPSLVPEGFMDTPLVNGNPYPYLNVERKAYRFRILNACNDRMLNLQLYYADTGGGGSGAAATATITGVVNSIAVTNGGTGYTSAPTVGFTGGGGSGAAAVATVSGRTVTGIRITNPGTGYTSAPTIGFTGGGGSGAAASATVTNVVNNITVNTPGIGYTSAPGVYFTGGGGSGVMAVATVAGSAVTGIAITSGGSGYTSAPTVTIGDTREVKIVPAVATPGYPETWPTDGRAGGVPDYFSSGPEMIQIGTEGGFLPAPVVLPNQPVGYLYDRRNIVVLNVSDKTLFLGPAERADVIIDFSQVPASTGVTNIIFYNDAPAPVPAFDPRLDYYTGNPDLTAIGGAPPTMPGYGPNIRTVMQFRVAAGSPAATAFDLPGLQMVWPAAYQSTQAPPIVPESAYGPTYVATFSDTFSRIQDTSLTFSPIGGVAPMIQQMLPKAIQELFELNYGRMNATLGVELPFTNFNTQTTIPLGYVDPVTETLHGGQSQIWKITHNGVDTHAIHFHLFNVQIINRVGWDGAIRPPDANELGWKETVRMNPLEDCIVAFKPVLPTVPFAVPASVRPLDVTQPVGSTITVTDPASGNFISVPNALTNFGHEYVWHCHLLGHEENDMMRPLVALGPTQPLLKLGDFNGDGKADLFWWNAATAQNQMWLMSSAANFAGYWVYSFNDTNWKVAGIGDFDGNGKADLVWRNAVTAQTQVWLMNGATLVNGFWLTALTDSNWQIAGVGDFDGDGKDDLVWWNASTGETQVWMMNGATGYTSYPLYTMSDTSWQIAGVGDFDGDGKADILWWNALTAQNQMWLMNGASFAGYWVYSFGDTNWQLAGVGDLDGDGRADLIWRNRMTGQNQGWLMNGVTIVDGFWLYTMSDTSWQIAGVGDFNGDGKADLVWRNNVTGQNQVWTMNGADGFAGSWLYTMSDVNWQIK